MKGDSRINIKNVQSNFSGLKIKTEAKHSLKPSISKEKPLISQRGTSFSNTMRIQTSSPNEYQSIESDKFQKNDSAKVLHTAAITSNTNQFASTKVLTNSNFPSFNTGSKKVFQQSSVQEIHNNVYNFFPGGEIDNFIIKKNSLMIPYKNTSNNLVHNNRNTYTQPQNQIIYTNNDSDQKNSGSLINEKNEYIKYLLNENAALKNKLKDKYKDHLNKNSSVDEGNLVNTSKEEISKELPHKEKFSTTLNNFSKKLHIANTSIVGPKVGVVLSPKNAKMLQSDCKLYEFYYRYEDKI